MTTISTSAGLPYTLLLLVHLHILEYPHANQAEYDNDLFNPQKRGLRDRIKSTEDITHFLVGKLEKQVKQVLPTYPCSGPSDSVAFRTSLSKYLENLRHQAMGRGLGKDPQSSKNESAWWWKDVMVRKSLFEECMGVRFERLLVALSTHVLYKLSKKLPPDRVMESLQSQPSAYTAKLSSSRVASLSWAKLASSLLRRQVDIQVLRERLLGGSIQHNACFEKFNTEKLVALSRASVEDSIHDHWNNDWDAFNFMLGLTSLNTSETEPLDGLPNTDEENIVQQPVLNLDVQSLPVAAAHHPFSLRKLRKPIFPDAMRTDASITADSHPAPHDAYHQHASLVLSSQLEMEKALGQNLANALAKARKVGQELAAGLNEVRSDNGKNATTKLGKGKSFKLWDPSEHLAEIIDFETKPTPKLLAAYGLQTNDQDGDDVQKTLDEKVESIRTNLLPQYPEPLKALPPPPEPPISKLPRMAVQRACDNARSGIPSQAIAKNLHRIDAFITPKNRRKSRKSVRFSMARRPSLFPNIQDEEVDRIVDLVADDSDEEFDGHERTRSILYDVTPRPARRLDTPAKKGMDSVLSSRKKLSFQIPPEPTGMRRLTALGVDLGLGLDEDDEGITPSRHSRVSRNVAACNEDDDVYDEAPSMTLRDILLRNGDAGEIELLIDEGSEPEEGDDLRNDVSFEWS